MTEPAVKLESLNCGNCGAPLKVPESAQFVTCNHCHSSLAIRRMESITLTEKMEQTQHRLEEAETRLAQLVYQNRVAEENRRWERERKQYMLKDKHGNTSVPTEAMGWVVMGIMSFFSLVFMDDPSSPFFFVFIVIGVMALIYMRSKAREYQLAYQRHRQRLQSIPRPGSDGSLSSPGSYLKQLESAPTPEDYLAELSQDAEY